MRPGAPVVSHEPPVGPLRYRPRGGVDGVRARLGRLLRGGSRPRGGVGQLGTRRHHVRGGPRELRARLVAGVDRLPLPQLVATCRDRGVGDDPHVGRAVTGEAGAVRGDLVLVDLSRTQADQLGLHQLAERAEVLRVHPQLDDVRRDQCPARRDHEHLVQVPQGELQHVLSVAPGPGRQLPHPRVIPGDAQGPQGQHGYQAEHREEGQQQGRPHEGPRHIEQREPARRDPGRDQPAPPVSPWQQSTRRPTRCFPALSH